MSQHTDNHTSPRVWARVFVHVGHAMIQLQAIHHTVRHLLQSP